MHQTLVFERVAYTCLAYANLSRYFLRQLFPVPLTRFSSDKIAAHMGSNPNLVVPPQTNSHMCGIFLHQFPRHCPLQKLASRVYIFKKKDLWKTTGPDQRRLARMPLPGTAEIEARPFPKSDQKFAIWISFLFLHPRQPPRGTGPENFRTLNCTRTRQRSKHGAWGVFETDWISAVQK